MSLDVRQDHLDIIKAILKNIIPHYDVVAFGSRTQGTAKKTSDLDLCVMSETPLSLDTKIKLRTAFSESDIPYKIDIVDWASLDEHFREIIANHNESVCLRCQA